jgi:hypothetical protein
VVFVDNSMLPGRNRYSRFEKTIRQRDGMTVVSWSHSHGSGRQYS